MNAADSALLIVDDNEDNRYTLLRRLKREGYTNLTTANDGKEALKLLNSRVFDLMLLDIMMPELNGYEVLEQLKASPALRDLPVIMISALDDMDSVIRCIELGAEDYLAKPFNATLLRARAGACLEKKRLRDEVRATLQRLEQELNTARELQLAMLPTVFPEWSQARPVQICASMQPAREVGGDLYDFFYAADNRLCFLVGDVSGKGAAAAMFMARTRSLVRMAVTLWQRTGGEAVTPAEITEVVNRELCQDNRDRMFVTLFIGFLDTTTGALDYVNAGHPAPYVLRSGDIVRIESKPDAPLGVRASAKYQNRNVSVAPGESVFVCTDGVSEAMNANDEHYTMERLDSNLRSLLMAAPSALVRAVKKHVDDFCATAPQADDVTMLALRWKPGTSEFRKITDFVIRNDLADLAEASAALERFGAQFNVPRKPLVQLQIALDEMASNVIKYAWPEGGDHEIHIRLAQEEGAVTMVIEDDGRPFDPLLADPPPVAKPGQPPKPGGLGIHFVKQMIDTVEFSRIGNRNRLTLIKRCVEGVPSLH